MAGEYGLFAGAGYEFNNRMSLEFQLMRSDATREEDGRDKDAAASSVLITLSFTGY